MLYLLCIDKQLKLNNSYFYIINNINNKLYKKTKPLKCCINVEKQLLFRRNSQTLIMAMLN